MSAGPCVKCERPMEEHGQWALRHLYAPPATEAPVIPVRRRNSDGSYGIEMITRSEWERRRPEEMDE